MGDGRVGALSSATTLLERSEELDRLAWRVREAGQGRGGLVLITGPSGIGKSTLLRRAREMAEQASMATYAARAAELESEYPFGLVLRLFERHVAKADVDERARLFQGRAVLAQPLFRDEVPPSMESTGSPSQEFAAIHGLYWFVLNVSEQQPLALIVDDVHAADELSLRFLTYLMERIDDIPVALLLAGRTGGPGSASVSVSKLIEKGGSGSIRPKALTLGAVNRLLQETAASPESRDALATTCHARTGGNPFLLHELIKAIVNEGKGWPTADPETVKMFTPESVRRRVALDLERLGREATGLARARSVLGENLPHHWAAGVARIDLESASLLTSTLVSGDILAEHDPTQFVHPIIGSAVYDGIPHSERALWHARAAKVLHTNQAPSDAVAQHLLKAPKIDEAWAPAVLRERARTAVHRGAPKVAVRYLRRVVEDYEHNENQSRSLVDLGLAEAAAGYAMALDRFEKAAGTLGDSEEQSRALYALGQTLYRYGRHGEAADAFRRGIDLLSARDARMSLAFEGAYMCAVTHDDSISATAKERLTTVGTSLVDREPTDAPERVLLAVLALHRGLTTPPAADAAKLARRALSQGALLREQSSDGIAVNLAVIGLAVGGFPHEAHLAANDVIADARERGAAPAFAEASLARAIALRGRGRIAAAGADAQSAADGVAQGFQAMGHAPHAILAECLIERGDLEASESILRITEHLDTAQTARSRAWLHQVRGLLRTVRGDPSGALDDYLTVGETLDRYGVSNPTLMPWRSRASIAANACGDLARGISLVDDEIDLARAFELPVQLASALRARAAILGRPAGRTALDEALRLLGNSDSPVELARVLLQHGNDLRCHGERKACRQHLSRAMQLVHDHGASALELTILDELRASGARPRRSAIMGLAALTPSELRIARMVAGGMTNREIAERLFISRNTVEWHLHHIYRKLALSTRASLAETMKGQSTS